jgi:hypothetical protein
LILEDLYFELARYQSYVPVGLLSRDYTLLVHSEVTVASDEVL